MDVGQENITRRLRDAHFILPMESQLKVVSPILPVESVVGNDRIMKENPQALEVVVYAIQNNNVWRNYQKVAGECRVRLVSLVKETPRQRQTHDLCLSAAGRHLDD